MCRHHIYFVLFIKLYSILNEREKKTHTKHSTMNSNWLLFWFHFFLFQFNLFFWLCSTFFFLLLNSLSLLSAQQSFDYTELCQPATILDSNAIPVSVNAMQRVGLHTNSSSTNTSISSQPSTRSRPWHDFGRQNDADKIQIPKM